MDLMKNEKFPLAFFNGQYYSMRPMLEAEN
jgi:hypothetical protein